VIAEDRRKFWLILLALLIMLLPAAMLSLPKFSLFAPAATPLQLDLAGSCQTVRPPSPSCARDGQSCALQINICG
jgi:hypothetical protein